MSYFRSNDPDRDFDRWDKAQQDWEDSLPHCDICGEPIDDHVYDIDGVLYCIDCMEKQYKRKAEGYVR